MFQTKTKKSNKMSPSDSALCLIFNHNRNKCCMLFCQVSKISIGLLYYPEEKLAEPQAQHCH